MPVISFEKSLKAMVITDAEVIKMFPHTMRTVEFEDVQKARIATRKFVHATIGFQELARRAGKKDRDFMSILCVTGRPISVRLGSILFFCLKARKLCGTAPLKPTKLFEMGDINSRDSD